MHEGVFIFVCVLLMGISFFGSMCIVEKDLQIIGIISLSIFSMCATALIGYSKADLPEYTISRDIPITQQNQSMYAIIDDYRNVNLTKHTGRIDISPEKHVYREFVSGGKVKDGLLIWGKRTKYEVVEKE